MNTARLIVSLLVCVLCNAALVLGQGADKQAVKLKYPTGTYRLTMTSFSNGSTTIGNQEQKSQDEERLGWRLSIPAPDDQKGKKATIKLVEIQEKSNGKETWNSAQPDKGEAALAFVYKPLMAADVQVVFDADDTLVEVVGLDKVMADLAAKAATDEQKAAVAEHIVLGDKLMERQFRTIESLMPRNAVGAGDKWQAGLRVELPVVGELKTRFDCRLKEIKGGKAVIEAEGTHELSRPKAVTVMGQSATVTKLAVKDQITVTVDIASGRVQGMETVSKGDVTLTAKDENGKDVTVAVKVDVKNALALDGEGAAGAPVAAPQGDPVKPNVTPDDLLGKRVGVRTEPADGDGGAKPSFPSQIPAGVMASAATQGERDWLIMVYLAADNDLDVACELNMKQMERGLPRQGVDVIVLADRPAEHRGKEAEGKWAGARLYRIRPDNGRKKELVSQLLLDLGTINMGDSATLQWFLKLAIKSFPAKRHALIMWDHGAGWTAMAIDENLPGAKNGESDALTLPKLRSALSKVLADGPVRKLDLVAFDMCLMAQLEVALACQGLVDVMVASEAVVPGKGLPYHKVIPLFGPKALATEIGAAMVKIFVKDDQDNPGLFADGQGTTMAALDLNRLDEFTAALDRLLGKVEGAMEENWSSLSRSMYYAQNFVGRNDFKRGKKAFCTIDLMDSLKRAKPLIKDFPNAEYEAFVSAFGRLVVAEDHGTRYGFSNGLAVYAPYRQDLLHEDYEKALMGKNGRWLSMLRRLHEVEGVRMTRPKVHDVRLLDPRGNPTQTIVPVSGGSIEFVAEGNHILSSTIALAMKRGQGWLVFYDLFVVDQTFNDRRARAATEDIDLLMPQYVDGRNLLRKEVDGLMVVMSDGNRRAVSTVELNDAGGDIKRFVVTALCKHPDFGRDVGLEIAYDTEHWQVCGVTARFKVDNRLFVRQAEMREDMLIRPLARMVRFDGTTAWEPTGSGELRWGKDGPSIQFELCPPGEYAMVVEAQTIAGSSTGTTVTYSVLENTPIKNYMASPTKPTMQQLAGRWQLQQATPDPRSGQLSFGASLATFTFTVGAASPDRAIWKGRDVGQFELAKGLGKMGGHAVLDSKCVPHLSLYVLAKDGVVRRDACYLAFYDPSGEKPMWVLKDMATSSVLRLVKADPAGQP